MVLLLSFVYFFYLFLIDYAVFMCSLGLEVPPSHAAQGFLDRRYAENPPSGFGMGQGQYGKQSSIPDTEVQYVHKDEYGNTHILTRELSHQERYKTLAKSDDRGKLVMGIHRTFWHKGISATVGRGHKVEKGRGMTYGVFNTTGDGVDSYGRPLTALELLRKKENDKKLALIRAEKKKRAEGHYEGYGM